MTGKGEYYVRCKNCGGLIKVFKTPSQLYCTKCETLFDYDTQDIVFSGITIIPSDYHEWNEEKNIEEELAKYKRVFEILKNNCHISNYVVDGVNSGKKITFDVIREWYDKEEYELLEELMGNENS